jgi:hypothetical protein
MRTLILRCVMRTFAAVIFTSILWCVIWRTTLEAGNSISTEYRYDALDVEDREKYFLRSIGHVNVTETSGMYASITKLPKEKKTMWSFAMTVDEKNVPFSCIIGDFNAGFGSGLLVGKGVPYNPDPFIREEEREKMTGFKPVMNAGQTTSFRGVAISRKIEETADSSLGIFVSRALRYYNGDCIESSIGTLQLRSVKEEGYEEPVYVRSAGTMLGVGENYYTVQCSAVYCDLVTPDGARVPWSSDDGVHGWMKNYGGSLYLGYNDGAVRSYIEYAYSRSDRSGNEKRIHESGSAMQTETEIKSELLKFRFVVKKTDSDFYMPFSFPIGTRSPATGVFISAEYKPLDSVRIEADASGEHRHNVTPFDSVEKSVYKEGLLAEFRPIRLVRLTLSYRQTGDSMEYDRAYRQIASGISVGTSDNFAGVSFRRQQKDGSVAHLLRTDAGLSIGKKIRVRGMYSMIQMRAEDEIYLDPLALDGAVISWLAVHGRAHCAALTVSFNSAIVELRARGLCLWAQRQILKKRIECYAEGRF